MSTPLIEIIDFAFERFPVNMPYMARIFLRYWRLDEGAVEARQQQIEYRFTTEPLMANQVAEACEQLAQQLREENTKTEASS